MIKLCQFPAVDDRGNQLIELFHHPDQLHHSYMDKVAAPFLPEVREYLDRLQPDASCIYSLVNALGAYEYWSCFPDGAPVKTRAGRVPIEDVLVGEEVLTHKNRWRRVKTKKRVEADWELVGLNIRGLPQIEPFVEATPLHEFWVVTREEMIQKRREYFYYREGSRAERRAAFVRELVFDWVEIGELQHGDYLVQPFPLEEDSPLIKKWGSPEIAILAGVYAAEGCTADRYDLSPDVDPISSVIFVLGDHDRAVVETLEGCAGKFGHTLSIKHSPDTHSYRVQLCWVEFAQFCRDHIGKGAINKFLSDEILRMPRSWQETFFTYYHGGDGYVRKAGKAQGTYVCSTASIQLALDTRLLLARLGLLSSITGAHNKKATWYNGNPIYQLCIGGSQLLGDVQNVAGYLHPDGYILSPIKDVVTRSFKGWVNDLQIEEDTSYTVNGVSAHNSNINGDGFEEEHLIHRGPIWGYETFLHYAKVFAHHSNKGPNARVFGTVELSAWNPRMHRIELVVKLDRRMADKANAHSVFDKIDHGELPAVSMGTKVPYDMCAITSDWDLYRKALATFNPKKHRHPGIAALIYHKTIAKIKGLSITRDDYSDYAKFRMNEILPDGRKVCVFNPFPRFFDISFVFIGAEKQSKMMAKLATDTGNRSYVIPSNYVAEQYNVIDPWEQPDVQKEVEKAASIDGARKLLREFKKKASQQKRAEIIKDVVPSQFGGKAVPVLENSEPDLPKEMLNQMADRPLSESISTPTMMGITLKPKEFQHIIVCRLRGPAQADELEREHKIFRPVDEVDKSTDMEASHISGMLARLLKNVLEDRGVLGPVLKRRMLHITIHGAPKNKDEPLEQLEDKLLDKISAAYNGYREQVIEKIAELIPELHRFPDIQAQIFGVGLEDIFVGEKLAAGMNPKLLLGAIPATYLLSALARRKVRRDVQHGKTPGMLIDLLAEHPHLAATGVGLAALKAGGSALPNQLLQGVIGLGKQLTRLG